MHFSRPDNLNAGSTVAGPLNPAAYKARRWPVVLMLLLVMIAAGCGDDEPEARPIEGVPPGFVLFQFSMRGDASGNLDFRAATNDPDVIAAARAQLLLPEHERRQFIIGPIARGDGGHTWPGTGILCRASGI